MGDKLKALMNVRENRNKWAFEWQKKGKKVIGIMPGDLIPEEVIYAAGMLPYHIQGTWRDDVSRALLYRPTKSNRYVNHVLQSVLEGELDFLDGVIIANRDIEFQRFYDIWLSLNKKPSLVYLLDVPAVNTSASQGRYRDGIQNMVAAIEELGKVKISDNSLNNAIHVYNSGRALLRKMYELRKKDIPPLSGSEVLTITTTSGVMPREEFNKQIEELLPLLEQRKTSVKTRPRILLSSDLLDNPAYVDIIEESGCLIAMDDMDTGSRYFWEDVINYQKDPIYALAKRYLVNCSPRLFEWNIQATQLIKWVKEFNIDAVIDLPDMFDFIRAFRKVRFEKLMKEAGITMMSFERDYHLANVGQLRTRIEVFLEMLNAKQVK